jgi:branched-chain amino acid aminotransferase
MTRIVLIDGRVVSEDAAHVSVFDRGFLHGDAIFEIIRTYDGVPFALDEHMARLARSAEITRMSLPVDEARLASEIREAVALASKGDVKIRVIVTRGSGAGLDLDGARDSLRVVIVEPLQSLSPEIYERGVRATTHFREGTSLDSAKTTNYLANIVLLRDAKSKGASEVILVDRDRNVREGASSNIFAIVGDELITPSKSSQILEGITRSHVMSVAREIGMRVREDSLSLDALYAANEVFLTSTLREMISIIRIDERTIGDGSPGSKTRALHVAFRAHVGLRRDRDRIDLDA